MTPTSDAMPNPKRGEVWRVDFEPSIGAETRKVRPAVVLSLDGLGALPLRALVPLTSWQKHFEGAAWLVPVEAEPGSGLQRKSAADVFQVRAFDLSRFVSRVGTLDAAKTNEIAQAVARGLGVTPATK